MKLMMPKTRKVFEGGIGGVYGEGFGCGGGKIDAGRKVEEKASVKAMSEWKNQEKLIGLMVEAMAGMKDTYQEGDDEEGGQGRIRLVWQLTGNDLVEEEEVPKHVYLTAGRGVGGGNGVDDGMTELSDMKQSTTGYVEGTKDDETKDATIGGNTAIATLTTTGSEDPEKLKDGVSVQEGENLGDDEENRNNDNEEENSKNGRDNGSNSDQNVDEPAGNGDDDPGEEDSGSDDDDDDDEDNDSDGEEENEESSDDSEDDEIEVKKNDKEINNKNEKNRANIQEKIEKPAGKKLMKKNTKKIDEKKKAPMKEDGKVMKKRTNKDDSEDKKPIAKRPKKEKKESPKKGKVSSEPMVVVNSDDSEEEVVAVKRIDHEVRKGRAAAVAANKKLKESTESDADESAAEIEEKEKNAGLQKEKNSGKKNVKEKFKKLSAEELRKYKLLYKTKKSVVSVLKAGFKKNCSSSLSDPEAQWESKIQKRANATAEIVKARFDPVKLEQLSHGRDRKYGWTLELALDLEGTTDNALDEIIRTSKVMEDQANEEIKDHGNFLAVPEGTKLVLSIYGEGKPYRMIYIEKSSFGEDHDGLGVFADRVFQIGEPILPQTGKIIWKSPEEGGARPTMLEIERERAASGKQKSVATYQVDQLERCRDNNGRFVLVESPGFCTMEVGANIEMKIGCGMQFVNTIENSGNIEMDEDGVYYAIKKIEKGKELFAKVYYDPIEKMEETEDGKEGEDNDAAPVDKKDERDERDETIKKLQGMINLMNETFAGLKSEDSNDNNKKDSKDNNKKDSKDKKKKKKKKKNSTTEAGKRTKPNS